MKNKNLYIALGGLATVVAVYVGYTVLKKKPTTFGEAVNDTKETIVTLPKTVKNVVNGVGNDNLPLKVGSKGDNVKKLQIFLNDVDNQSLVEDGIFGAKTLKAVIEGYGSMVVFNPAEIKGQISEYYFNQQIKNH
jgi:hypothetical protein